LGYKAGGQIRLSVIVFLTLQHRVVLGGKLGSLHSHSCSVEIEVSPPRGDTIPFAEIEAELKAQITPLDGKTLNDLANFQGINPTVENFAAHLYNRLSLIAAEYGAILHVVTVRESPTRAVKYLREESAASAGALEDEQERGRGHVLRLPVAPPEESEIEAVRRLRAPVTDLPLSPHQRPASDFQPAAAAVAQDQEVAEGDCQGSGPGDVAVGQPGQAPRAAAGPVPPPDRASPPVRESNLAPPEAPSSPPSAQKSSPVSRGSGADSGADAGTGRGSGSVTSLPPRKDRKRALQKREAPPTYGPGEERKVAVGGSMLAASPVARVAEAGGMPQNGSPLPSRILSRKTAPPNEEEPEAPKGRRTWLLTGFILLVFLGATAFLYRRILWPPPGQGYPWGSDTWGHIKKAQFLLQEILNKNYFPCFSPMWYNGVEPFRYWAPLPYYLLAGLMRVLGDPFLAAGWYVAVCAFIGGAGWLLMKDRLGLLGSGLAGFIWLFWQDNVRVAMSEGNLPRTIATAIFPYLLHCFLLVIEKPRERSMGRYAALAIVSSIAILAHAMIAATFFIGLTLLGVFWALWMGVRARDLARGILGIFTGIGLTAWWLVPSLQSGLLAVNKEAVSEAMQYFPIATSMNPYLRLKQPEIFYWGLSFAAVAAVILITWKKRPKLAQSSVFVAAGLVAITTPALKPLYSSIPMHYLIFPLYMATVASGIVILAAFSWKKDSGGTRRDALLKVGVSVAVALILAVDAYPSTALVSTRTEAGYLKDLSRHMPADGWREATLDLSRFGSAATYMLGQESNRELVYGWAWQGATTATNIVGLNAALEYDFYPYLLDRLIEMGATHLVVRREIVNETRFIGEARRLGFTENWRDSEAVVFSTPGGPYALTTAYQGIVIGKFAPNWARLFPAIATGTDTQIDKYSFQDLEPYRAVIISGAVWEDRTKAEDLVSRLAAAGKTVLVDLEGLPEDVLSRRPVFLGVTGEPVLVYRAPELFKPGDTKPVGTLMAFAEEYYPWKALSPQGIDVITYQFPHLGENVAVLGSRKTGAGVVWFIGANLPYHAYLTRDPLALDIISKVVGIDPWATPARTKIPMSQYSATARGYSFSLNVPAALAGTALTVPVASRDNMVVRVDGVQVKYGSLHNLLSVTLDPGPHSIAIVPEFPSSMRTGAWVSLGCLAFIVLAWLSQATARVIVPLRKQVVAE
jgi:uncharacterized membrane protein/6-pyruvoyl-tetrahydropterin synthase